MEEQSVYTREGFEPTFKDKKEEFSHEKERIGELAADLVEDGYSVILDTGNNHTGNR